MFTPLIEYIASLGRGTEDLSKEALVPIDSKLPEYASSKVSQSVPQANVALDPIRSEITITPKDESPDLFKIVLAQVPGNETIWTATELSFGAEESFDERQIVYSKGVVEAVTSVDFVQLSYREGKLWLLSPARFISHLEQHCNPDHGDKLVLFRALSVLEGYQMEVVDAYSIVPFAPGAVKLHFSELEERGPLQLTMQPNTVTAIDKTEFLHGPFIKAGLSPYGLVIDTGCYLESCILGPRTKILKHRP